MSHVYSLVYTLAQQHNFSQQILYNTEYLFCFLLHLWCFTVFASSVVFLNSKNIFLCLPVINLLVWFFMYFSVRLICPLLWSYGQFVLVFIYSNVWGYYSLQFLGKCPSTRPGLPTPKAKGLNVESTYFYMYIFRCNFLLKLNNTQKKFYFVMFFYCFRQQPLMFCHC